MVVLSRSMHPVIRPDLLHSTMQISDDAEVAIQPDRVVWVGGIGGGVMRGVDRVASDEGRGRGRTKCVISI